MHPSIHQHVTSPEAEVLEALSTSKEEETCVTKAACHHGNASEHVCFSLDFLQYELSSSSVLP
jgi:hypothetical protein